MDEFSLTQVVEEPTRHNNILDLVFTTHRDLIEGTYVVPGMSDHSAVVCLQDQAPFKSTEVCLLI